MAKGSGFKFVNLVTALPINQNNAIIIIHLRCFIH